MAEPKSLEDQVRQLTREVGWLKASAAQAERSAPVELVARCTIFASTLALLLSYLVPWGAPDEDEDDDAWLTGWDLFEFWADDLESGIGTFIARYVTVVTVIAAIAGLALLVPLPRVVGVVLTIALWLMTAGMGLTVIQAPDNLEFEFAGGAWLAVIIMGATASSWTWWTTQASTGWLRFTSGDQEYPGH